MDVQKVEAMKAALEQLEPAAALNAMHELAPEKVLALSSAISLKRIADAFDRLVHDDGTANIYTKQG